MLLTYDVNIYVISVQYGMGWAIILVKCNWAESCYINIMCGGFVL